MKLFKWTNGRQPGSRYKVFNLIFSVRFLLDCVIIKYPTGSNINPHYDKVDDGKHYRINIVIWKARKGGKFICDKTIFSLFNRIHLFRPDLHEHSVTEITEGTRIVFSMGKTLKDK